jgi:hypothetical protein
MEFLLNTVQPCGYICSALCYCVYTGAQWGTNTCGHSNADYAGTGAEEVSGACRTRHR